MISINSNKKNLYKYGGLDILLDILPVICLTLGKLCNQYNQPNLQNLYDFPSVEHHTEEEYQLRDRLPKTDFSIQIT